MKTFSKDYHVPYYDFNLTQAFPISEDLLFFDSDHLNAEGAKRFTEILSNTLNMNSSQEGVVKR